MFSTIGRQDCLKGLLIGSTYAQSVATSISLIGRSRAKRIVRSRGRSLESWQIHEIGVDSQLMLMAGQAILNSCSDLQGFQSSFMGRLRWLPLGMTFGLGLANRWAATLGWLRLLRIPTGFRSRENSPLTRSMIVALSIHGTGHKLAKWIEGTTRLTHTHPDTVDSCLAIAVLSQAAGRSEPGKISPETILSQVTQSCKQQHIKDLWQDLGKHLEMGVSPRTYSRHLNSLSPNPKGVVRSSLISAYCFLSSPTDFSRAIGTAITMGGDHRTHCAVVGGLAGIHVGFDGLPSPIRRSLFLLPHGANWMDRLSHRLARWPHGEEDLNWAPSLYSWPLLQLLRNMTTNLLLVVRFLRDLPLKMIGL